MKKALDILDYPRCRETDEGDVMPLEDVLGPGDELTMEYDSSAPTPDERLADFYARNEDLRAMIDLTAYANKLGGGLAATANGKVIRRDGRQLYADPRRVEFLIREQNRFAVEFGSRACSSCPLFDGCEIKKDIGKVAAAMSKPGVRDRARSRLDVSEDGRTDTGSCLDLISPQEPPRSRFKK